MLQFQEKRGKGCQVFSGLRSAGGSQPGQCFPPNTARSGLWEAFPSPPNASGLGGLLQPLQVPGSSYFPVPCRTDFSTKVLLVHSLLPWWRGSRALSSRVGNNSLRGPGGPSHLPLLPAVLAPHTRVLLLGADLHGHQPTSRETKYVAVIQRSGIGQTKEHCLASMRPEGPLGGSSPFCEWAPYSLGNWKLRRELLLQLLSCRRPLTGPFPPPAASLPPKLYSVKP